MKKAAYKVEICIILTIFLVISSFSCPNLVLKVYAEDITPQEVPEKVRIEARTSEPAIGYNEFDNYYADLKWDPVKYPADAVTGYINVHLQEVNKPYKPSTGIVLKERDLPGSTNDIRLKSLSSGTIYFAHLTAYHTHLDGETTYNSSLSMPSNSAKFLTDINITATSYGTNQIKIEWDDVWNTGRRIDYKLYISENKEFNNTQPIYIGQSQIEPLGPIKVNQTSGKLEYIHTVDDPGRVYYIKIAPDISEPLLKKNNETGVIMVSSFIIARTTKVSTMESGSIWRMDWSPVVTGLGDIDVVTSYQIFRGNLNNNDVPQYIASVDDTNFFITVPPGENNYYYIIIASIKKNGEEVYEGIKIKSDKIILEEHDVVSIPAAPEIVEGFERAPGDYIISYEQELTPNTATILWNVPKKGDGSIDNGILYDIWLIDNPNVLDDPPDSTKIVSNFSIGEDNYIIDGVDLVGYKYTVTNLTPNSTYYFKIIAKKEFIDYIDGKIQSVTCKSEPSVKVIITPTEGAIDQPKVPARPPFGIKKSTDGKDLITDSTVTIKLKNKWYEKYDETSMKWEYIRTEKTSESEVPPYVPEDDTLNGRNYRLIEYDSGVTIDVGCVEYIDGMSYNDISNIVANKITSFPITPNDSTENASLNPDGLKHNVDIKLTNLVPNTTYIIWIRASRKSVNLLSGPSDPIVITTAPKIGTPVVKPTVPIFNYGLAGDTFVELGWNFNSNYKYTLKYGTVENIESAIGSQEVNQNDIANASFYKLLNLEQNTLYFFWVQAETLTGGSKSEWSDSYSLKTLPFEPPDTPSGFGIKNGEDSVTKNSLTFEWIKIDGIEYKLEISSDIDYKNLTEYSCGAVSEYMVEELKSNFRYYARLYAYDPEKDLYSEPTQSITVRTERSNDDYDSDENIDDVIKGDYCIIDPNIIDNTWNISILGVNADRFIEHVQTDNKIDYKIDLTKPPIKVGNISISIDSRVLRALDILKENLIIVADSNNDGKLQIILQPQMLGDATVESLTKKLGKYNYKISLGLQTDNQSNTANNMSFKTKAVDVGMDAIGNSKMVEIQSFGKPLKVVFPYTDSSWYKEGKTYGYIYNDNSKVWTKLDTTARFNADDSKGYVTVNAPNTGKIAVAEPGKSYYSDTSGNWAESSINNIASVRTLKSISGSKFEPDKVVNLEETVKLMLDVMEYDYENDYMLSASRSQIVNYSDTQNPSALCTREKVIGMISRLYEIKTGTPGKVSTTAKSRFKDMNEVSLKLLPQVNFAIQNGLVANLDSDTLKPRSTLTKAEVAVMLERLLMLIGEL